MRDMEPAQLVAGDYREHRLTYHDGTTRKVLVVDQEVAFPDGKLIVSRTDPKGIITHANEAFVFMSGFEQEELIGEPHHILRHPDMPAAAFKDLWDTVEQGHKWHGYVRNLRKDGAHYWVYAVVIQNLREGRLVGYTSVRRKPSRTKVNASAEHYARMLAEEDPK